MYRFFSFSFSSLFIYSPWSFISFLQKFSKTYLSPSKYEGEREANTPILIYIFTTSHQYCYSYLASACPLASRTPALGISKLSNLLSSCHSGTFCSPSPWCARDLPGGIPAAPSFRGKHPSESYPSCYRAAQTPPVPSAVSGTTKTAIATMEDLFIFPLSACIHRILQDIPLLWEAGRNRNTALP